MDSVDKILTKYQLQRETAEAMIVNSPCFNWVDLADEIGVSEDTIHNYKRAFKQMSETERLRVIAVLSQDRFAEVVDGARQELAEKARAAKQGDGDYRPLDDEMEDDS